MIWITADTHFGHTNIINLCARPFLTVEEMDRVLIENWNTIVRPEDTVYHLGDFCFRNARPIRDYRRQLNGNVVLIRGNHDRDHPELFGGLYALHTIYCGNVPVTLCHYALRSWPGSHRNTVHLYGHSHGGLEASRLPNSMDVGVDSIAILKGKNASSYHPIPLEEAVNLARAGSGIKLPVNSVKPPLGRTVDIVPGTVFGHWTVLEFACFGKNRSHDALWRCQCTCGRIREVNSSYLRHGHSKSCAVCANLPRTYDHELPLPFWQRLVHSATKRGIEVVITREQAYSIYLKQDRKCALTGLPVFFPRNSTEARLNQGNASLDRIDNQKGYTPDNVQWVHKKVNIMRNVLPVELFVELCKLVAEHCPNKAGVGPEDDDPHEV